MTPVILRERRFMHSTLSIRVTVFYKLTIHRVLVKWNMCRECRWFHHSGDRFLSPYRETLTWNGVSIMVCQVWFFFFLFLCASMWLDGNNKTLLSLFYTSFSTPYGTLVGTHTNSYVNQKETCRVVASHLNFVPSEKEKKFHENNI